VFDPGSEVTKGESSSPRKIADVFGRTAYRRLFSAEAALGTALLLRFLGKEPEAVGP
jgi:hypothetical protein